jgi:hypothetical protein
MIINNLMFLILILITAMEIFINFYGTIVDVMN